MKLTGELKDKVDQTANLEEAKDVIAQAGMLLTDDEVSEVAGGGGNELEFDSSETTAKSKWKPVRGQIRPAKSW